MAVRLERGSVFGLGDLVVCIQQLKHTGRAGQGVLQLGDDAGDLVERLGVLVGVAEEDAQLADGDAACHGVDGTHQAHAGVDDVVDKAGGGVGHAGEEDGLEAHVL